MKRAQGLPISTIIIAALGILVLVVVGAIFGGQIGKFGRAASECPGRCVKTTIPPEVPSGYFEQGTGCNPEFETKLSGTYLPRGTPKDAKVADWQCSACCVPTG